MAYAQMGPERLPGLGTASAERWGVISSVPSMPDQPYAGRASCTDSAM
jgi:hypothetical protein